MSQNADGFTPLHLASMHGTNKVIQALLAAEADITARHECGSTSVHSAASFGTAETWSCRAYVPVCQLIYSALRLSAKGLLPPSDECRRGGLKKPLMYRNIAPSAWRLVSERLRQISSALMDLKNVSNMELS